MIMAKLTRDEQETLERKILDVLTKNPKLDTAQILGHIKSTPWKVSMPTIAYCNVRAALDRCAKINVVMWSRQQENKNKLFWEIVSPEIRQALKQERIDYNVEKLAQRMIIDRFNKLNFQAESGGRCLITIPDCVAVIVLERLERLDRIDQLRTRDRGI